MSDALTEYFAGEKQAAVCLALAAVAVAFSLWLWRTHEPFRAMALPVLLVGLVQLGIGVGLLARTGRQVATLRAELQREPAAARATELARMDRVNRNFRVAEVVEAVLIAGAVAMVFAFRGRPALPAIGLGILVPAAVMLAFDVFAEHRAHIYSAVSGPAVVLTHFRVREMAMKMGRGQDLADARRVLAGKGARADA